VGKWISSHRMILILALITATGLFLRFYTLGTESIWYDEASSIFSAKSSLYVLLRRCVGLHRHPPLYFFVLKYWIVFFGDSETAVRSLSAVFGVASVPLTYIVGKQLFNSRVGIISSFLLSISAFAIYYSQEARAYSMLVFFTLLSFALFIKIIKDPQTGKPCYIAYFIANTFMIYTHYFGLFVVVSQIGYYLLTYRSLKINSRWFWRTQIFTGLAFLPWAVVFVGYSIPHSFSWEPPTLDSLADTFGKYSGYNNVSQWLVLFFGCLCILGLISRRRNIHRAEDPNAAIAARLGKWTVPFSWTLLLVLFWLVFPIIPPFLISQISTRVTGIYSERYTISALPAFLLLTGSGLEKLLTRKALYPLFAAALIAIIWFSSTGLQLYYSEPQKEQWREAVAFSQPLMQKDDIIILSNISFVTALNQYYKGDLERHVFDNARNAEELAAITAKGKHRIWLFQGIWGPTDTSVYLLKTIGKSLIVDKKLVGVEIYLFDISNSSGGAPEGLRLPPILYPAWLHTHPTSPVKGEENLGNVQPGYPAIFAVSGSTSR
jgi:mannosyltransferase